MATRYRILSTKDFTAAGDILVGTAANASGKLGMGSSLQVIRVNAGGTALEYATPIDPAALLYKGVIDCSGNPNYPAASVGDYYLASVAGKIGGAAGKSVNAQDGIYCMTAGVAGDEATVGANWGIVPSPGIPTTSTRTIFLSLAGGWTGTTLPDSGPSIFETATNKVNFRGTKFIAASADMNHEFSMPMPLNYDGSTITARPYFYTAGTDASSHTIIFGLQAVAFADGDTLDTAYGTAQESTETVGSSIAGKLIIGATTAAITIAGNPAGGNWTQFRCYRKGSDTSTNDVILLGWLVNYTTDQFSDV
jgi:hypothetical protein